MNGVVVGVDSSTQSCKVLVLDAETGVTVAAGSALHPSGTAVDPWAWIEALRKAWAAAGVPARGDVLAVGIAAQQHGMVALDREGVPVHDALLWNDVRSAEASERMIADLGVAGWLAAVGVVPLPAITITKLAWLREHRPEAAARVHRVMLPHDWLVLHLTGAFATDRSDASGTGYFSAAHNSYRTDLLERYFGAVPELPRVLDPDEPAGMLLPAWGRGEVPVSAGAGDNAAGALALELAPGEVVLSVGTSGTVYARTALPVSDCDGLIAGFADAAGGHLPLLCTLNAARVITSTAQLLGLGPDEFDDGARLGLPDAGGLTMLPYFEGERSPNLPGATGSLHGLTLQSFTAANLARAAALAVANSLADGIAVMRDAQVPIERVLLIGGGAKSSALRVALADTVAMPVVVPEVREYVAMGAARQAAWVASGRLPSWERRIEEVVAPANEAGAQKYRGRYVELRSALSKAASPPGS